MTRSVTLLTLAATAAVLASCASAGSPATSTPSTSSSPTPAASAPKPAQPEGTASAVFTEVQAGRGRDTFQAVCSDCHYTSEFKGSDFQYKWRSRTISELFDNIAENMPDDSPGSLSIQEYVDVVAYILQLNGFPAGSMELTSDGDVIRTQTLEAPTGSGEMPAPTPEPY